MEKYIKLSIGKIYLMPNENIELGKDYKISLIATSTSKEEISNVDSGEESDIAFKLKFFSLESVEEVNSHKILKTDNKASKSQILRLKIEELAHLKGVKQDSVENYYSSILDSFIKSVEAQINKLNSNF